MKVVMISVCLYPCNTFTNFPEVLIEELGRTTGIILVRLVDQLFWENSYRFKIFLNTNISVKLCWDKAQFQE